MTAPDFHAMFIVDYKAGRLRWKAPPKNHAQRVGNEVGYLLIGKGKNKSYWQIRANGGTYKRSRVIFFMAHGRWPTPAVDHINGDSTDDRLSNLRECTQSQNTANSRDKCRITNLPKGVYLTKQGRYMARITKDGATTNLGTFDTIGRAMDVYAAARKEAFGDFA